LQLRKRNNALNYHNQFKFDALAFFRNPANLILPFLVVIFLAYFINVLLMLFSYNIDLGYGMEYALVCLFQRLPETGSLYSNPASPPFMPNLFLPLYFYITYFIHSLFTGGAFENIHSLYITGRILSFLSFIGTSVIAYFILTRQLKCSRKTGLISVMLIFILSFSQSFIFRPDSLKTFFFVLSIYLFIQSKLHHKKYLVFLFSVIAILAFFTKQDGLIASAIIFTLLFSGKNRCSFYYHILISIITTVLLLLLIYVFDHSIVIFKQMNVIINDGISFWYIVQWILPYMLKILPVVLIMFYLAYIYLIKERPAEPARKTIMISVLFTFFFPLIFSLKNGASIYYFSEFQIFAVILIADFLEKKFQLSKPYMKLLFSVLFIAYIVFLFNYKNIVSVNPKLSVNYMIDWYNKDKETRLKINYFKAEAFYKQFKTRYPLKKSEYLICFDVPVTLFASKNFFNIEISNIFYAWIEYLSNQKFAYKKTLFSLDGYYSCMDEGRVKYIIIPDLDKGRSFVNEYFPNYASESEFGGYVVYKWTGIGKVKRMNI